MIKVNIGHGHLYVIKAIQEQVTKFGHAYPGIATEPRARLGELLCEIAPGDLSKSFFTLAGADAIENAMKIARMSTNRQKVITRYRSYHGATFGAITAGGDRDRLANEPGVSWIVRVHGPYSYRSLIIRDRTNDEGDRIVADLIHPGTFVLESKVTGKDQSHDRNTGEIMLCWIRCAEGSTSL